MAIEIPVVTTVEDSALDALESRLERLEGRGVNIQVKTETRQVNRAAEQASKRTKDVESRAPAVAPRQSPTDRAQVAETPVERTREITAPEPRTVERVAERTRQAEAAAPQPKTSERKPAQPKEPRFPVGPAQRYRQAQEDFERVLSTGDDSKIFDAFTNIKRQEAAVLHAHTLLAPKLPKAPVGSMDRLQDARRELARAAAAAHEGTGTSEALFNARVRNARAESAVQRDQRVLEPKKPPAEPKLPQGPNQRLQQARDDYQRAQSTGNDLQKRDAQLNLAQRQKAYDRAMNPPEPKQPRGQPADFGKRLTNLIYSTRVGVGAGGVQVAPLVGRMMSLFGEAGPLGMAVAAGALLIDKLGESAGRAAQRVSEYGQAQFIAGGTPRETAEMSALGRTVGIDPASMAGMAREFAARQAGDPFARQAALQAGIVDPFGGNAALGKLDTAKELSRAIDFIGKAGTDEEAQRRARILGLEQLGNVRLMSTHTRNLLKADAELAARISDRGYQKESVELQAQTGRLQTAFENLENTAIRPLLPMFTHLSETLADFANRASEWLKNYLDRPSPESGPALSPAIQQEIKEPPPGFPVAGPMDTAAGLNRAYEQYNKEHPDIASEYARRATTSAAGQAQDRQEGATEKGEGSGANDPNTSALDKNTDAINRLIVVHGKEAQWHGGGPRSRGAVPSRWRGPDAAHDMQDELTRQSYRLGAF